MRTLQTKLSSLERGRSAETELEQEDNNMAVKYVFVTGGVVSGLGKGITAEIGRASCRERV